MIRRPILAAAAVAVALAATAPAFAQSTGPHDRLVRPRTSGPRKQFVTVTIDRMNTLPLHFKEYPLEELVGQELSAVFDDPAVDYRSRDGLTSVDVLNYRRRNGGFGVMVYPLGAGNGVSLALRGSYEELPDIRFTARGPAGAQYYQLTDGRALDAGAGIIVNDRDTGWGLGSHTFVVAGIGRLSGELGDGRRVFAEGGGGLNVGPFGVQLAVKFARNTFDAPRAHSFITVPVTVRGTVSF